jgi:hypothetical protein
MNDVMMPGPGRRISIQKSVALIILDDIVATAAASPSSSALSGEEADGKSLYLLLGEEPQIRLSMPMNDCIEGMYIEIHI